jgi:hypothetical protein
MLIRHYSVKIRNRKGTIVILEEGDSFVDPHLSTACSSKFTPGLTKYISSFTKIT